MENKQLLLFERNRYYSGKMLTSTDFLAEQTYLNGKRRFLNSVMLGDGIAWGYSVYSLDDQSILIESGVAIDSWGREIVVEKSLVKKLSAIEGFEQLKSNEAVLCLRYAEEKVHTVYAVGKSDREEPEFNRICEGYELFLLDAADAPSEYRLETEFFTKGFLFLDDDYQVTFEMPATVCKGRQVKLTVRAQKLSDEKKSLDYSSILQIPAFLNDEDTHEISVDFESLQLRKGESVCREFWLMVQRVEVNETDIVLKAGSAVAQVNGKYAEAVDVFSAKIALSDVPPRELIAREIGKVSLETRGMNEREPWVRLADIRLARTEQSYLIDEIPERQTRKYIQTPADAMLRQEYMDYFRETQTGGKREKPPVVNTKPEDVAQRNRGGAIEVATGTLEIPLGDHIRKGDTRYSGEILHGLGKGNVYVEIGYEWIEENRAAGANIKSTIYGNPALFPQEDKNISGVETAVKVLNDKGSFVVAARLTRDVGFLVLTYQWVAIKFPTGNDMGDARDIQNKSIQAETPTVMLGAKESYYFGVRFINMEHCSIAYELSEGGGGEITSDGVYTAPNKEGVYEIRIYCTDNPIICTYAYAIVRKSGETAVPEQV